MIFRTSLILLVLTFLLDRSLSQKDSEQLIEQINVPIFEKEFDTGESIDYRQIGEPKICGYSPRSGKDYPQNKKEHSKSSDWPWIGIIFKQGGTSMCGASLITSRHVLTAAHCFTDFDPSNVTVKLGEYDMISKIETDTVEYNVRQIRSHEDYDYITNENDIAILYLTSKVEYSPYVLPVCLPSMPLDLKDTVSVVIGWGSTQYQGYSSTVLHEVLVPILKKENCQQKHANLVHDTNICGDVPEGRDACQGDSGGPMMTQRDDGRWMVTGIVSWGIRCGKYPGIYTRVDKYLDWIAENVQD